MMSSTFTTFDMMMMNHSQPGFSYIYGLLPAFMYLQLYWINMPSRQSITSSIMSVTSTLINSTNNIFIKGAMFILTPTFFSIIILNLYGAAPYTITLTSHLMMTLSTGGPVWFTLLIISMFISLKVMTAHLLPENTPTFIASFLSLVETLSSYIRPITLSFRLSANISAGHVILGMMTSGATFATFASATFMAFPVAMSSAYTMFELAICLVQAFVFTLLASMYSNDYLALKKTYDIKST
uniref:ATP synthase subunit a n=1 Tax=Syllis sp. JYC-2022 TaxID=2928755 RepID=A0A976RV21_9ANNE|nr:ATP synthase F0 subunit 6 [Syllis sp. JYC-2022]